jgi:hypothetical protein
MAGEFASFRFTSGMDVWIADDKECWVRGIVTKSDGNSLTVRKHSDKTEKVITVGPNIERELLPSNQLSNTNITDIIRSEYLHEASLLETLRVRHSNAASSSSSAILSEEIYTYAGPVLLSCNPYKRLDIYGHDVMRRYSSTMDQVNIFRFKRFRIRLTLWSAISSRWITIMLARCIGILTTSPRALRLTFLALLKMPILMLLCACADASAMRSKL